MDTLSDLFAIMHRTKDLAFQIWLIFGGKSSAFKLLCSLLYILQNLRLIMTSEHNKHTASWKMTIWEQFAESMDGRSIAYMHT